MESLLNLALMTGKTLFEHVASSSKKISSTDNVNSRAMLNAKGKLGSNLSFSMALAVCLDTSKRLARSAWIQSLSAQRTF